MAEDRLCMQTPPRVVHSVIALPASPPHDWPHPGHCSARATFLGQYSATLWQPCWKTTRRHWQLPARQAQQQAQAVPLCSRCCQLHTQRRCLQAPHRPCSSIGLQPRLCSRWPVSCRSQPVAVTAAAAALHLCSSLPTCWQEMQEHRWRTIWHGEAAGMLARQSQS